MKVYLLVSALLLSLLANAQQAKVIRINATYDTTAMAELYNRIPIGLQFIYSDSSHKQTAGYLRGDYRWNKINIATSNGWIVNGVLTFSRAQLAQDHYRIDLTVTPPQQEPVQTVLVLPKLTGIRFNHYADSVKRDIRYYLNVEGKFSSGRILPLDTSVISFNTSDGQIIGQDLLIDKNDTTRLITVEAWYKPNPNMYLRSVLPVKQLPDPDLPPADLQQKGRKSRKP
ncbi:MAG TPA: hypothetical protein VM802_21295 [Chitinophaga sp.]|uniref:hypothetical protein n=1 Tax=Chitinophaga sp. TaxID=1869181 RepID=UPI002C4DD536|nr:hypothetical protein [Chitinophaga sp.]HVI47423.1 hypothetical protein [Chitinophaga sp.]